jgi:hypothetical protein
VRDIRLEELREIISKNGQVWVLFEHGTVVVLREPEADPKTQAIDILREYGPVVVGTELGDFNVVTLDDGQGWMVTASHEAVFTYVRPDDLPPKRLSDFEIGLYGRNRRDMDGKELNVVHVEDRRG